MVDAITKTSSSTATSTTPQTTGTTTDVSSVPTKFDEMMRGMLTADSTGQVSEEDLFAANVGEKLSSLKGSDVLDKYKTTLAEERTKATSPDGFVQQETAAINSLKRLVADGTITSDEGDQVYTESFKASQLDDNANALYDSRGGVNDPTTAMALLSSAIAKANEANSSVTALTPETTMSLASASATGSASSSTALVSSSSTGADGLSTITPKGTYVDGAKGFLFKPVTNNSGALAVMGAAEWTGNIASMSIKDSQGNVIEEGKQQLWGVKETGQEKYAFSKPGGSYPKNITVEVTMKDGSTKSYQIADPSQRYD